MSERHDDSEEDRDLAPELGSEPDPTNRPIPLDPSDGYDISRGVVREERIEIDAEMTKDGGKLRFRGAPDVATQVLGVGCVVAGGILWPTAGWEPGTMVAVLGPAVAWFFRRR